MPFKISVIIIDDEKPAREEMLYLLGKHHDIDVVAICSNAIEAKEQIEKLKPDAIFLDIAMPYKNGFTLLQELVFIPQVIFVTAYDSYALKAIEENALDYLLKPVLPERLQKAIERLRRNLEPSMSGKSALNRNLFLRDGNAYHLVRLSDIFLIEAYGNYVKLYAGEKVLLQQMTLKEVVKSLDAEFFFQINRSQIINISHVNHVKILANRQYQIELTNKTQLVASSRKSADMKEILQTLGL